MEKVGRYQIREAIGEGAMAKVFKAYDPDINRDLAIKVLKSQLRGDSEYHLRFLREAKGAGVLSHPNIVTVFDVGDDGGHPYIAMELIEGPTLSDLVGGSNKQLPVKTVVEIGIQLVRALDYAHKKGIVHRDVKPGNIMMIRDSTTIKVADFGICRIDNSDATQATQVGNVLGTPNFMSPEQVLGEKVDSRSDLFSAGVVLYQVKTGHLPIDGEMLIHHAYKDIKPEAVSIDELVPVLPQHLCRIVDPPPKNRPNDSVASRVVVIISLGGVSLSSLLVASRKAVIDMRTLNRISRLSARPPIHNSASSRRSRSRTRDFETRTVPGCMSRPAATWAAARPSTATPQNAHVSQLLCVGTAIVPMSTTRPDGSEMSYARPLARITIRSKPAKIPVVPDAATIGDDSVIERAVTAPVVASSSINALIVPPAPVIGVAPFARVYTVPSRRLLTSPSATRPIVVGVRVSRSNRAVAPSPV